MQKITAPYGSWKSPLTADNIVQKAIGFGKLAIDQDAFYWLERRPQEKGRGTIMRRRHGIIDELVPEPYNVRTRVHEYGGGDYTVSRGIVYFSNFTDQQLYKVENNAITKLTNQNHFLYADAVVDEQNNQLICIREDRTTSAIQAINTVVAIDLTDGKETILVEGNDFYSSPRISPDGKSLCYLTWNHPDMPWDGTELWTCDLLKKKIDNRTLVAGSRTESIVQPEWSPDNVLYYLSDKTNWWNLYRHNGKKEEPIVVIDAELGTPQWIFGISRFGFSRNYGCVFFYKHKGALHFCTVDCGTKKIIEHPVPFTSIGELHVTDADCYLHVGYRHKSSEIVHYNLKSRTTETIKASSTIQMDQTYLSPVEEIAYPTTGGQIAYAYYYPPKNEDYIAPENEKPPLFVHVHGGPTAATGDALDLSLQYYTSRGFAVVDVNYRGSTGYGRRYREALKGMWGVVDIDDCVAAVAYVIRDKGVDPERVAISGGSAGGYTVLGAITFRNIFTAGASYFGISDLELLAKEIHKFESRYLESLVAPYPQEKKVYEQRSPIHYTDWISKPVIFLQGLEDLIVPPNQAERMVDALRSKGIPVAYIAFEGEQHGFRQGKNIKKALESEYYFYSKLFSFSPADHLEEITIENL